MATVPPNTLFQVPLARVDVWNASRIQSQKPVNPQNCGAASGLLLGLLTPAMAEYYSAWDNDAPSKWASYWKNHIDSDGNTYEFKTEKVDKLKQLSDNMFAGCGTLLLFSRPETSSGHWVVLAKYIDGTISLLDLQTGVLIKTLDEMRAYISRTFGVANTTAELNNINMGAFLRTTPASLRDVLYFFYLFRARALITNDEVAAYARRFPVPSPNDEMVIGGRRRSRKTRKIRSRR
jgi:hypothetical protein